MFVTATVFSNHDNNHADDIMQYMDATVVHKSLLTLSDTFKSCFQKF